MQTNNNLYKKPPNLTPSLNIKHFIHKYIQNLNRIYNTPNWFVTHLTLPKSALGTYMTPIN